MKRESTTTELILGIIFIPISTLYGGFVLVKFWTWFFMSIFPELPMIGYMEAVGLSFALRYFIVGISLTDEKLQEESISYKIIKSITIPTLALLFGYIIYLFT